MKETQCYGKFILFDNKMREKIEDMTENELDILSNLIADNLRETQFKITKELEKDANSHIS